MKRRRAPVIEPELEARLVHKAQAGDKASMSRLLSAHYERLFALAMKLTRDPDAAVEVTQESCLQVLRRLHQLREPSAFSSWLSRIVVNTALLRKRRSDRLIPVGDEWPRNGTSAPARQEALASSREVLKQVEAYLKSQGNGEYELFTRRFVDGVSLQQICDETGLSMPAVKSRFHRVRQRLKDEFQVGLQDSIAMSLR
ncbi:MAG: RNA polymerase sigma factor [Bradymonadia bacterium]